MTALMNETKMTNARIDRRRWIIPPLAGLVGALALVGVYLGILSALQSPGHALEQLSADRVWVGLVALGFGIQVGLYAHLRQMIDAMRAAGATAMTGAGTGTSTLGMVACCAHHITDVAPLLGVAGVSGLSGVATFLGEWKIPFIILGLVVNAIGIAITVRTIRKHRRPAIRSEPAVVTVSATACH